MYRRIVVKVGTSVLTGGTARLDQSHMVELVRQCAALHRAGTDVIICTSGAIAAGRERLGYPDLPATVTAKQMLAAVGQSRLMLIWERLFEIYGIHVGQMLLTKADVKNRRRFLNARDTMHTLLEHRIIPIINENDAVATAEIKVGDNDNLSALVTLLAEADLLLLLTDQAGLFTADPRADPEAQLIQEIKAIDATVRNLAGGSKSGLGTGGMVTKLQAAHVARRAGADVVIAAGNAPNVITQIASGVRLGTRFPALQSALEHRKRWVLAGPSGALHIDAGAEQALVQKGSSLLPAGIIRVEGSFERGASVVILGASGEEIGRGVVRYSSEDLDRIKGRRSDEILDQLGYGYGPVAVHRNDFVLTHEIGTARITH